MARSDIHIRMFGDNRTSKMFNQFRKDTRSSSHAINNLRNQIIAAFSVRELVTAGDTFVNLQNRMGALTGNATDTADAMAHMKRIAIESRSDFSAVGDLFAKITFATKEMGLSQQEVADATQTVANTFIISGASAIEAANASRQLAQGLASGTLRGDELNSVMEQNSALAELLAKGLGVSTGQLREMGAAGKITAENILPTLISATDETNKTIADMNMTIGQSISLLKTQFTTLIGEFEKATGVFGTTASAIGMLAKNMELLLIPATALAVSAIPKLVSGVVALGIAIRANPLTALATGLAALVATAKILNPELSSLQENLQSALGKQKTALNNLIKAQKRFGENSVEFRIFQKEYNEISDEVERLRDLFIEQNKAIEETPDSLKSFLDEYNKIIEKSKEGIQVVKTFAETIEGKLTNAFTDFFDIASEGFGNFKNLATSIIRAIVAELVQLLIVQKAVGMIKSSIDAFAFAGSAKPEQLLNLGNIGYEGGGYTGMGVRAGGFDELLASRKNMIISMINQAYNSRGKMGIA